MAVGGGQRNLTNSESENEKEKSMEAIWSLQKKKKEFSLSLLLFCEVCSVMTYLFSVP
jgi:hypothetical protein